MKWTTLQHLDLRHIVESYGECESVLVVLYFTATWCAPCRFIGPVMNELAWRTPEVTIYKIDIDEENLAGKLKELKCYICESKKEEEVIGADATSIVHTMKRLYNMMDLKPDEESKEEVNALPEEEENDNLMIDELIPLLKQAKKYAFLPVVLLRGKIRDITIQGCI
ncbi:hypothetical protein V6N12_058990 [Hibiscus sabdariffa]|uniref:Thioredoxin domain-containing protein n=1 Tax=Hibiscus sabdariffa TaxID=183260 RepID=A0ABR2EWK6_9ROSI